ncbi:hypothetical protein ACP275_05G109700 [Erythranthe tilingii]
MAGMALTPAPVIGRPLNGGGGGGRLPHNSLNSSGVNALRISAMIERLSRFVNNSSETDASQFLNLCLSLSRGIDFAITNHEVPSMSRDLPSLVKQVCQNKNDNLLQAAIMVLMISIKSACQSGWFSDVDSEELSNLAKEIEGSFCSVSNFNSEPSCSLSVISTIMSRFYPRMKMGHIFSFLEVKPGYYAYARDFQIPKNIKSSPGDQIRLFVVQTDSIETSSCLISPAKVSFLLNGHGVEKRTNLYMDTGPQIPTVVTPLLKYGSNLLQAVGEFNGNYIIVVASMGEMRKPDSYILQDYEQQAPASVDSDSEVIVGSSRISLNCPISFTRIKTPVKGHSCKHIQCFDFDNFVDINSRRPSWRCPHCNQYVCFPDIRIDQNIVKVLKEVGPNVSDIIVSSDWSWNAVNETEDTAKKPEEDNTFSTGHDSSPQPADVMDLTQTEDAMVAFPTRETTEDVKHFPDARQSQPLTQTAAVNTNDANQTGGPLANNFWSDMLMSTFVPPSNARPNAQIGGNIPIDTFTNTNRELEAFHGSNNALDTTSAANTLPLQQYQFRNTPVNNDYGRFQSAPRHITRVPNAVQALPAQSPTSVLQRGSVNSHNSFTPNSLSTTAPNFSTASRAHPHQVPPVSSSSLLQHIQQQNRSFSSAQPPQQNAGFQDSNQVQNTYRLPNGHNQSQQIANLRMSRTMSQPSMQSSGSFARTQTHAGGAPQTIHQTAALPNNSQQSHLIAAANRAAHMAFDPSRTAPSSGVAPQPITRSDASDPTADMTWRPAGRMRGALVGQDYNNAYKQYVIRPNQQAHQAGNPIVPNQQSQAVRPNSNAGSVQFRPVNWDGTPHIPHGTR